MSKKDKLLEKAASTPKDFSFQDLETLLGHLGFKKIKTNAGSHLKWRHNPKKITYMAPRKNPVKTIYLRNLLKIISIHFQK